MENILFINCCVRKNSRTKRIADHVLKKLSGSITEIRPFESGFKPVSNDIIRKRHEASLSGDYSDSIFDAAKQFANAGCIVIAAPYWDLSFPASLKVYIENISVSGITFTYNEDNIPEGLCKAKRFIYITTAGGPIGNLNFGYEYINGLFGRLFGIEEGILIKAEMLDADNTDTEAVMQKAIHEATQIIDSII